MEFYSSKFASCRWCCLALIAFAMAAAVVNAQNLPADYVNPHNTARSAVGVASVAWDSTVAAYAQNYANARQSDCNLVHSGGTYGENLFRGSSIATAADAVSMWVSEKPYYDYATNSCTTGKVCTDYTQVVWNTTTVIGCARVVCLTGSVFIVCNYNPAGNTGGPWRPY